MSKLPICSVEGVKIVILAEDYAGYNTWRLLAQHGFSAYIEAVDENGVVHRILFDVGQHGRAVVENSRNLNIDLGRISTIVLSHNHYDHTDGLPDVLNAIGRRVSLVCHPDVFKQSLYIGGNGVLLNVGPSYSLDSIRSRCNVLLVRDPLMIAPGIYYLGEIPRDPRYVPVVEGLYTIEDGRLTPHKLLDDTALTINVRDLGLVVISGCGHSGIVNIVRHSMRLLGTPVRAVVGGLHFIGSGDDFILKCISELKDMGVERVYLGHCTGFRAETLFAREYGECFERIHVGYTIKL